MNQDRRSFLRNIFLLLGMAQLNPVWGQTLKKSLITGNFNYIFTNQVLKSEFKNFLINVFHLYPEDKFFQLLEEKTLRSSSDQDIYLQVQSQLESIKPLLSDLTYSLPALKKQKEVIRNQTLQLVDKNKIYKGHLELGTTGRYLGELEDVLNIQGDQFCIAPVESTYSPIDIIDRGQISKLGTFIPQGNYSTDFKKIIPAKSIDMVTVYIGFHHCPLEKREEYITSVRDIMSPGGKLILRDHDAHNEDMIRMAALAHDVFNLGIMESWQYNQDELRHFYSLDYIITFLSKLGFKYEEKALFQEGDPTKNALMAFTKV